MPARHSERDGAGARRACAAEPGRPPHRGPARPFINSKTFYEAKMIGVRAREGTTAPAGANGDRRLPSPVISSGPLASGMGGDRGLIECPDTGPGERCPAGRPPARALFTRLASWSARPATNRVIRSDGRSKPMAPGSPGPSRLRPGAGVMGAGGRLRLASGPTGASGRRICSCRPAGHAAPG